MDPENDMHDANDLESFEEEEDHCYSETMASVDCYGDGDYNEDYDDLEEVDDDSNGVDHQKNYTILSEADMRQLQEEDITRLSTVLSIPRVHACILMHHYNWNYSKLHDEWFVDEGNVRKAVGLFLEPVEMPNMKELNCAICFASYLRNQMSAASCGHQFCNGCWRGYICTSINDGPGCLTLQCPEPSCTAAIGQDMVNLLACDEDKEKYSRYLLRSYIEDNKKTKWCPAPGCDFAVNFDVGGANHDVCCRCTHTFCWDCTEEAHRPVICETVAKWILKNNTESENMNWILANSKSCPKCKRPIEKNHGCMHMTCTPPCKFEFCWLCLGAWSEHGERTGGYYACNRYEAAKQYDEAEKRRERARNSLERYTHYYERWASNQMTKEKALADLNDMHSNKLDILREKVSMPQSELNFVTEAWEQIVECRRVLKWTYAYGFYIPEHEDAKRQLFEYLQGEAESGLERLHICAEKETEEYEYYKPGKVIEDMQKFIDFKSKLALLTSVTRKYFENLVHALVTGLQEVDSTSAQLTPTKSKSKEGKSKGAGTSSPNGMSITSDDYMWQCSRCTYANHQSATECMMCAPEDDEEPVGGGGGE